MLIPKQVSWLRLLFKWKGSELPRLRLRIAGVALVSIVVTLLEELRNWHPNLTLTPFTLMGVGLSIFLGFRNNASYDRWWEGRKLWGALVNTSRTAARQITTLVGPQPGGATIADDELRALRKELVYRVIAFTHALRLQLRNRSELSDLAPFLPAEEIEALKTESNRPFAITQGTADRIARAWQRGLVDPLHLPTLEATLGALTDIQGGCERIKSTPIPFLYQTLIHRLTAVYCYTLAFGVVDQVKIYTPFVVVLVAYMFFGLDLVGDEIEDPFGEDANDLPLNAISRTIEINLRQRLGESELPSPLVPVDDLLT